MATEKKKTEAAAEKTEAAAEKTEAAAEKTEAAAEKLPDPYELEEIFIPRAGAKEDPNLFVSVNGKNFLIPKGKKSKVPRYIADEIRRSERARDAFEAFVDEATAAAQQAE